MSALERPRWPVLLDYSVTHMFDQHGSHRNALSDGWCGRRWDGRCESLGPVAALDFCTGPSGVPLEVELVLAKPDSLIEQEIRVAVSVDGKRAWVGPLTGDGGPTHLDFHIHPDPQLAIDQHRIEIKSFSSTTRRWISFQPRHWPNFQLVSLRIDQPAPIIREPAMRVGKPVPVADLVGQGANPGWTLDGSGAARITAKTAVLVLSFEPNIRSYDLRLDLCRDCPMGWLHMRVGSADVFSGRPYPGRPLHLRTPRYRGTTGRPCA